MKKIKQIVIIILLLPTMVLAQKKIDVVYLNNGSIIRGIVLDSAKQSVSISTFCGNLFVYNKSDVKEIRRERYKPVNFIKNKGYINFTSMGMLIGSQEDSKNVLYSITMEHNYRINKHLAAGFVTGIEWFNVAVLPMGANAKFIIPAHQSSFFVGCSGGYVLPLEDYETNMYKVKSTKGGFFGSSELGIILGNSNSARLYFAVGYRYQHLMHIRDGWNMGDVKRNTSYNRVLFNMGVFIH